MESKRYTKMSVNIFFKNYHNQLNRALDTIDTGAMSRAIDAIMECVDADASIFVCGNGGSAAIADHLTCDCLKGIRNDTDLAPRVVSLSSNGPLITAIANDMSYERVFAYQLESLARHRKDILITISSSGNSPNIREAIETAKAMGITTIALCGFEGGASLAADIPIHVNSNNYGIVEDCHQSIMHMISQYIRVKNKRDDILDLKL